MTINELQKVYDICAVHFCHKQHKMMQLCKSKSTFIPFLWHHESKKLKLKKTNILSLFLISKKTETKKSLDQRGVGLIDWKAWKTYRKYISWQREPCHKYERLCLPAFRNEKCITCMKNNLLRVLPGMLCSWINWKIRIF